MRPIWSGTISFGLVSVPVRMFSATESKELRLDFLHKDDRMAALQESVKETKRRSKPTRKRARKAS